MAELLETHCTFVDSWSDPCITNTMLRCFGRNAAIRQEEIRFMNEIVASGMRVLYREADDFELSALSFILAACNSNGGEGTNQGSERTKGSSIL
jgi:hypothetical protein